MIQALDDAAAAREQALELHRASGDLRAQGWNLSRLATLRITKPEALDYAQQAVEILEQMPPGRELASACADMAAVLTVRARAADALQWGRRALALAEQVAEPETLAYALNICGSVELSLKYEEGALAKLERSWRWRSSTVSIRGRARIREPRRHGAGQSRLSAPAELR